MFALLFVVVLLLLAGISVILLVRPSLYMRRYPNPWMQDTPWTRMQMRVVGLVFFLFVLMVFLGIFSSASKSGFLKGFSDNILVALWLAFISAWNEFLFALTFTVTDQMKTVPVVISQFSGATSYEQPWGSIMAASMVVTIPLVILVMIFQYRIVAGLTAGAVKG